MSDLVEKYNARVAKESALFEEKCKRIAYAAARRQVKQQMQETYNLNEEEAEAAVSNKVNLVKKYASRLLPKVKQAQMTRASSFQKGSKIDNLGQGERLEINESINTLFTEKFAPSTGMSAKDQAGANKLKGDTAPQSATEKRVVTLQMPQANKQPQVVFSPPDRRMDNPKLQQALGKKAAQSQTSERILEEVFVRGLNAWTEETGVSPEQYGFARVNSFINKGKAYKELDADLVGIDESLLLGLAAMGGVALGAGALGAAAGVGKAALRAGVNHLAGGSFAHHLARQAGMKPTKKPATQSTSKPGGPNAAGAGTTLPALHGTTIDDDDKGLPSEDKPGNTVRTALKKLAIKGAIDGISSMSKYKAGVGVSGAGTENAGMMPGSGIQR